MAQIEVRNLRKSFKDAAVLKGLSLSVDKGEIVALFGPPEPERPFCCACLPGFTRRTPGRSIFAAVTRQAARPKSGASEWRSRILRSFRT